MAASLAMVHLQLLPHHLKSVATCQSLVPQVFPVRQAQMQAAIGAALFPRVQLQLPHRQLQSCWGSTLMSPLATPTEWALMHLAMISLEWAMVLVAIFLRSWSPEQVGMRPWRVLWRTCPGCQKLLQLGLAWVVHWRISRRPARMISLPALTTWTLELASTDGTCMLLPCFTALRLLQNACQGRHAFSSYLAQVSPLACRQAIDTWSCDEPDGV
mmetsp:Transcript_36335/g.80865  ORF Transcript_36335/g.80865 Transcript_36335/m.80865 type:complete len:214 (-) Transcript_36335:1785-2426(-)